MTTVLFPFIRRGSVISCNILCVNIIMYKFCGKYSEVRDDKLSQLTDASYSTLDHFCSTNRRLYIGIIHHLASSRIGKRHKSDYEDHWIPSHRFAGYIEHGDAYIERHTLKYICHHFHNIFAIGCSGSCRVDNFRSSKWQKCRQNDIPITVQSCGISGLDTGLSPILIFSNAFSSMKMCRLWWAFHWIMFLRVKLTRDLYWFR